MLWADVEAASASTVVAAQEKESGDLMGMWN
jgi:hypothetical protein